MTSFISAVLVTVFLALSGACYAPVPEVGYCDDIAPYGIAQEYPANFSRTYISRTDSSEINDYGFPNNKGITNTIANACTPKAGTHLMTYFDRFFPDLIPNFDPGVEYNGYYYWGAGDYTVVDNLLYTMADLMGTNVGGDGTTVDGFMSGMKKYAKSHGNHTFTASSVMKSADVVDRTALRKAFAQNQPVVMFLNPFYNYVSNIIQDETGETVYRTQYLGSHTVIAYGITHYTYYTATGSYSEDFLSVEMINGHNLGYLRLDDEYCDINEAYALTMS